MQDELFSASLAPPPNRSKPPPAVPDLAEDEDATPRRRSTEVLPLPPDDATRALAATGIFAGYRVIEVPEGEEGAANVLRVNDRVIAGAGHPGVLDALDKHGLNVVALPNSAIAAIDAGFTCMSLRWRAV